MTLGGEARYVAYASGNLAKNVLWATADVTLLYVLTDLLDVPASTAGVIFLVGLLFDAVLDLVVGAAVERSRTRLGQYGPFIVVGAPLSAGAFLLLYSLPWLGVSNLWVIFACVILFRACYAICDLPHTALITKVAASSRGRSRVAGYRFFFSSVASLSLALIIPRITIPPHREANLAAFALLAAVLSAVILFIAWFAVRRSDAPPPRKEDPGLFKHLSGVVANPTFAALAWITCCTGLTAPLFAKSCVYYARYVLEDPAAAGLALTCLAIGQFAGVGLWTWLASRREKAFTLCAAHLLAAAAFAVIGVTTPDHALFAALAATAGVGLSGVYMLLWGMAPDVVDYGEFRFGRRHEATTFALLLLISKAAMGVGAALLGWSLGAAGYVPDMPQTPQVRAWIVLATCAAPALGCLTCAALTRRYLLTHRRHGRVVAGIARRAQSSA